MASAIGNPAIEYHENSTSNSVAYSDVYSPKVENARKPCLTPLRGKKNKQEINEKIKAAEQRRKSNHMEEKQKAELREIQERLEAYDKHVEEVRQKLREIQERLEAYVKHVEEVRQKVKTMKAENTQG